ncbi:MAG: DUF2157 domain-containing protein, partial [Mesorhizobium sp.]|nr:DUF2157 domain-containing protein [Mesorhizobium sp.]
MASHSTKVKQDIARWLEAGLIDGMTADALARDVEANERRSLSFGSILAMMAALLLGAAILIFVAANWEAIPRLARVGALFAIILGGYVGGAFVKARGYSAIGEALWIVAAAAFGGSIALIGQMYHFSGDESAAVLTWCAGTALAALALRSGPLTVAAVGIADAWLAMKLVGGFRLFSSSEIPHLFVVIAAGLFAVSYWTRSYAARHLLVLSLIFYVVGLAVDDNLLVVAVLLALVSGIGVASADDKEAWRLFVADRERPKVTVVDTVKGQPVETLQIKAPASLFRSESGRTVFAVQGDAGTVTAIASGISFEDHGDHG